VVPAPASADTPNRLIVLDRGTGRRVASWPLFERPTRVVLYGGIAILSGANRHGLYALRISDGRIAQIGIARAGDRPLIGPAGVIYQNSIDKHPTAPVERTLTLLPLSTVRQELNRPFTTVRLYMSYSRAPTARSLAARVRRVTTPRAYRGADPPRPFHSLSITAMSMDGGRVALAVRDPAGRCDYVLFWNVLWHYVTRLTRVSGPQCLPVHLPGGITNVAIAGSRAVWTTTYGGKTRVLAASITDCQEWVVARPRAGTEHVAALAGDTGILAYAFAPEHGAGRVLSSVGVVPSSWRGASVEQFQGRALALSADDKRIAALGTNGTVLITTLNVGTDGIRSIPTHGDLTGQVRVGRARAIALRANVLAALSDHGTLDLYDAASGDLLHSWAVAANATSLDMQYGIALVTAGQDVYAVNAATGRAAHLFHAPTRVAAQIEAPGAAIEFNVARRAHIAFLPMSQIEASTR